MERIFHGNISLTYMKEILEMAQDCQSYPSSNMLISNNSRLYDDCLDWPYRE